MLKRWALGAPAGLAQMREDIDAVLRNDPAARTPVEVVLTYPGVHALWIHRVSHDLFENDFKLLARVISHANRFLTGIEIHPGAHIASGVFIDHGMGVVIGETATIGTGCLIYKGVLLGGTKLDKGTRHPQLGKNVVIGSNACLLGAIEIGDGARVGAGSVVVRSVPEGATVVGVPARVVEIQGNRSRIEAALDHANLPDPVSDMIRALAAQNERLRSRLRAIEHKLHIASNGEEELELGTDLVDEHFVPRANVG